jgi:predicted RNA-binding protein with PUA-like domain
VKREPWTGVRNYQARNFMWRDMRPGDLALFYHSNASPPGIAGIARVAGAPYADETQFDPQGEYHDPKATRDEPRWWLVDFEFVGKFTHLLPLDVIKADPVLADMKICQRGTRLSIVPVEPVHFKRVCKLAGHDIRR